MPLSAVSDMQSALGYCSMKGAIEMQRIALDFRMGPEWQRIRSILNPRMLKPRHVSNYSPAINQVVTDFIRRIQRLRDEQGDGLLVSDMAGELYRFAFEGMKLQQGWLS